MNSTKTIYVDVTQLVHWQGKITGIPRVMHELALRFHQEPNVVYVSWVKSLKTYCEIDYEQSIVERNGVVYKQIGAEVAKHDPAPAAIVSSDSTDYKHILKKAVKKGIAVSGRLHPALPEKIYQQLEARKAQSYRQVSLGKGDTVFIGWGEWWDENFLAMLEQSQKNGAHITTFIHDVGPMITPHLSGHSSESLANYCRRIVPICTEVFVNSKCTKDSLQQWLKDQGVHVPPITACLLGDDFTHKALSRPTDPAFTDSGLEGNDYIMTVGTVELKKNHIFLYYVYRLAQEKNIALPKLVIVGRQGWGTETNVSIMMNDPALKDKFVFLFDTSDEELAWLYKHARFSVFPSFYEGWGIPLAESLFYGVPAMSARSTSLMEIGQGIVERYTQASTDECLALMQKMNDDQYLAQAREKARSYKPATWDGTYETIYNTMKQKGIA